MATRCRKGMEGSPALNKKRPNGGNNELSDPACGARRRDRRQCPCGRHRHPQGVSRREKDSTLFRLRPRSKWALRFDPLNEVRLNQELPAPRGSAETAPYYAIFVRISCRSRSSVRFDERGHFVRRPRRFRHHSDLVLKGGWIIGASGGGGTLIFHGRRYPLSIGGLSAGLVFGASERGCTAV